MPEKTKSAILAIPKPAISYARFSSLQQREGNSLARQKAVTDRLCREYGLKLMDSISLEGVSAYRGKNLEILCQLVEDGRIPSGYILLVEDLDRLSRLNPFDCLPYLRRLLDSGVSLLIDTPRMEITSQSIRSDPSQLIVIQVMIQRAHSESERKSQFKKASWKAKWQASQVPNNDRYIVATAMSVYGIDVEVIEVNSKSKLRYATINEQQAAIINRIFKLTEEGWSPFKIATTLNDEAVRTATRKAQVWRDSFVRKILYNRSYLGEYVPHTVTVDDNTGKRVRTPSGDIIKHYFPQIVSDKQWKATHNVLKARSKKPTKHLNGASNLLTNLVSCSKCGESMVVIDKGKDSRAVVKLVCSNRHHSANNCDAPRIPRIIAEATVVSALMTELRPEKLADHNSNKRHIAKLQRQIERTDQTIITQRKEVARIRRNLARVDEDHLDDLQIEFRMSKDILSELEKRSASLSVELASSTIDDNDLSNRRNQIEDLCIQALCGLPGQVYSQRFANLEFFSLRPIPTSEKNEIRVKMKSIIGSLVTKVVFHKNGTTSIALRNKGTLKVLTLDPARNPNAVAAAFDGLLARHLYHCGPKPLRDAATPIVAMLDGELDGDSITLDEWSKRDNARTPSRL